ncbi:MAG: lysoplasmalogenase [Chloroflexi bacterium]|nr:MAG: lysoplasmalogenase [Chloroflexota bacterium]MBL1197281.1 lysoplasmalogenase [Chloroflexota bacterium]NOH14576.1 lysoplasmalogenase [Chloroflexota bacterium]
MIFVGLAGILAVLDWYAIAKEKTRLGYFTKPGVMLALLIYMWTTVNAPFVGGDEAGLLNWIFWGAAFSLAGDVFLMLPKERFVGGLIAFLFGHIAYAIGFDGIATLTYAFWPSRIIAFLLVIVAVRVYLTLARSLAASERNQYQIPVALYTIAITVMVYSALTRILDRNWYFVWSYAVAGGALLFYFSDVMLAWNRFVRPLENGRLKVRIAYHLGQIAIVVGATMHFSQYI